MHPDFLGIGAEKAGTSWLGANLRRHPAVWLGPEKELHHFDRPERMRQLSVPRHLAWMVRGDDRFARRWRWYARRAVTRNLRRPSLATLRLDVHHLLRVPDDDWYLGLFDHAPDGAVTGEITPGYASLDEDGVAHLHRLAPDARIVFLLRNPVERAWSHAMMNIRLRGGDPATASEREVRRQLESAGNRARTDYRGTLDRYAARYGPDRVFVGFMEDITRRPVGLLARVYDFLGLGELVPHEPIVAPVYSSTVRTMSATAARWLAAAYEDQTTWLADTFGGYARGWSAVASRLRDDSLPDRVPYPFLGTPLWPSGRFGTAPSDPVLSGPLAAITTRERRHTTST